MNPGHEPEYEDADAPPPRRNPPFVRGPIGPAASSPLLGAVSPLMRSLMEAVDVEDEIPRSLGKLGESLDLLAAALYEGEASESGDAATMELRYSWESSAETPFVLPQRLTTSEVFGEERWALQPRSTLVETKGPGLNHPKLDEEKGKHWRSVGTHRTFVPILRGGNLVACLATFANGETRRFSNYESSLLAALASSFGGALLRQRAQEQAQLSELRYQRLFERNLAGVYRTTTSGKFLEANSALARLLGVHSREELLSRSVYDFYYDRAQRDDEIQELRRSGSMSGREVRLRRSNGSAVWVLVNETLVEGGIIEGTLIDISDRKSAERRALRSEKLQSLGVLAGGIAHDFNNLLTSVLGNISIAREMVLGRERLAEVLETVEGATLRAKDMAAQLLTFARGGQPIKRVVDVQASVFDAVQLALTGSNVHCELDLDAEIGSVSVDIGQWNQVLCNLLINASQAMPEGGTIRVRGERIPGSGEGEQVHLVVQDEGPGIEARLVDKIFDPFFTTKKEGSGLGLATCHSVLERHGGRIDVELPQGGGTAFHVWLPADTRSVEVNMKPVTDTDALSGRLLLLDDRADVREVGEMMLSHLGFEVVSFEEGESAVRAYRDAMKNGKRFDGLIMDLTIPGGMGGVEALRLIRESDPDAIAFVSSGYSNDPVMANYEEAGFNGVIEKPYRLTDLREVLYAYFGASKGEASEGE